MDLAKLALSLLIAVVGLSGCSKTSPDFVPAFAKDAQMVQSLEGQAFHYNVDRPYDQTLQAARAELLPPAWREYTTNRVKGVAFERLDGEGTVSRIVLFRGSYILDSLDMPWLKPGEGAAILHMERAKPSRGFSE